MKWFYPTGILAVLLLTTPSFAATHCPFGSTECAQCNIVEDSASTNDNELFPLTYMSTLDDNGNLIGNGFHLTTQLSGTFEYIISSFIVMR